MRGGRKRASITFKFVIWSKDVIFTIIVIEPSYTGPHLPSPISLDFVKSLISNFKDQKKIHKRYLFSSLVYFAS